MRGGVTGGHVTKLGRLSRAEKRLFTATSKKLPERSPQYRRLLNVTGRSSEGPRAARGPSKFAHMALESKFAHLYPCAPFAFPQPHGGYVRR